jgi:hypothetical protein
MEIIIKNVRLSYPTLFTAKEFKAGDGKPRWSAAFIIEPGSDNDQHIRAAIEAEAKTIWGVKAAATLKTMAGQSNKYCYTDGNTKAQEEYKDMMVLATHRSAKLTRPVIIDKDKSPLIGDTNRPYGGCYVNAKVEIYCQTGENSGVRASFSVVQFYKDGDPFSASTPSTDGFDAIEDDGMDGDSLV